MVLQGWNLNDRESITKTVGYVIQINLNFISSLLKLFIVSLFLCFVGTKRKKTQGPNSIANNILNTFWTRTSYFCDSVHTYLQSLPIGLIGPLLFFFLLPKFNSDWESKLNEFTGVSQIIAFLSSQLNEKSFCIIKSQVFDSCQHPPQPRLCS